MAEQTTVLSSMEDEYMAASAATQEAMWLNRLLQQLGFKTPRPTKIMRIIRQLFYSQIILVITGGVSILILGDTLLEMLYSMVISCWNIYPKQSS